MIGILGGMGTHGLDFCNKLAKLNKGKVDQNILYLFFIINLIFLIDLKTFTNITIIKKSFVWM